MISRAIAAAVLLPILVLAAAGCSSAISGVRARFAAEVACPAVEVDVRDLTNRGFRASGCGQTAVYVSSCDGFGCFGAIIVRNGPVSADGSSDTSARSATSADPEGPTEVERVQRAIDRCGPFTHSLALLVAIGGDGDVLRVTPDVGSPPPSPCIVEHTSALRFGHRADAIVIGVPVAVTPRAPDATFVAPAATTSASTAPAGADAAARAIVDRLHDVLLACSDGAAIAVTASWTAGGEVTLSLSGSLAGSAADGCVRESGAGTIITPAPGAAGSVRQPVH